MMNPKRPPPAAAFSLLYELNTFFALSKKEREAAYTDYMTAAEQHEAALENINREIEAGKSDRATAAAAKRDAVISAKGKLAWAEAKAKEIVDAAVAQAESVNETARENVAAAAAAVEAAEEEARTRTAGLAEAEKAVATREDDALVLLADAKERIAEAEASKAFYDALIADINALQRRAPK